MTRTINSIFKDRKINLLPNFIQDYYYRLLNPIVGFLIRRGIHPNLLTTFGLVFSILSAILLAKGYFFLGGLTIIVAGTCDLMDGKVARATGLGSKFGALYDSAIDRYSEVIMFFGVCFYFIVNEMYITSIAVFIAVTGSLMVSYIRAKSESLGLQCKVGLMQRQERIVFLASGALFGNITFVSTYPLSLMFAIWIIAISANYTAVQRLYYVWKETLNLSPIIKEEKNEKEGIQEQDV